MATVGTESPGLFPNCAPHETGAEAIARARRVIAHRTPSLSLTQLDRGWIYFIQAGEGGHIKIGTALDVERRIKKLQQAQPARLILLAVRKGGRKTERRYHERFSAHRVRGEWFNPHPDILKVISRWS